MGTGPFKGCLTSVGNRNGTCFEEKRTGGFWKQGTMTITSSSTRGRQPSAAYTSDVRFVPTTESPLCLSQPLVLRQHHIALRTRPELHRWTRKLKPRTWRTSLSILTHTFVMPSMLTACRPTP